MSEYKQLRLEFNRESNKDFLRENLGCVCSNCGSSVDVEYHHIVPLAVGGTNKLTNIVPLCYVCHQIVHDSKNIRRVTRSDKTGRPKSKPPEGYKKVLRSYISGNIGRSECEKRLGLSRATKLSDVWYYKEFMKDNGIKAHKNKIDILDCKKNGGSDREGRVLAHIKMEDGSEYIRIAGSGDKLFKKSSAGTVWKDMPDDAIYK